MSQIATHISSPVKRIPVEPVRAQPTLYDVARLSGLSIATVSRVFSGKTPVAERTRERVVDAARELAYEPSHAARALAGRKTHTLGAIFPEIASGFYADVLAGIDEVAAESGFDVLASFVGKSRSRPELIQRLFRQGRVDALILLNLDDTLDDTMDEGIAAKHDRGSSDHAGRKSGPAHAAAIHSVDHLPIVLVDHEISGSNLPVIGMDNVGGAEAMIEHLYEQGHRNIAVVSGPDGNFDSNERIFGCRRAFERLGLRPDEMPIWKGAFSVASGREVARDLLDSGSPLPDAIFCLNDVMAIGMLSELNRAGIRVPGDVALAGYDNLDAAAHLSLTSVACPMRLMGQVAARWAVDFTSAAKRPRAERLQVRLVVRDSSAGPSKRNARVIANDGTRATMPAKTDCEPKQRSVDGAAGSAGRRAASRAVAIKGNEHQSSEGRRVDACSDVECRCETMVSAER